MHNHPRFSPPSWGDRGFAQVKRSWWEAQRWDSFVITASDLAYVHSALPGPVRLADSYFFPGWGP